MSKKENIISAKNVEFDFNSSDAVEKKLNLPTIYDVAILGAGPAGLTAAIYSSRYMLDTIVIGNVPGGMISGAHKVCNFPTYTEISGVDLTKKMYDQVLNNGVSIKNSTIKKVIKLKKYFKIILDRSDGEIIYAKKVIVALGSEKRKLGILGEKKFQGKGVSYCATCDGPFFKDKIVAVVGGSDAALTASLLISEYAKKVYLIYRKNKFIRAEPSWVKQAENNSKINFIFNSNISAIDGSSFVESIKLDNGSVLEVDGVFVEVGSIPNTNLLSNLSINLDNNYIVTDKFQKTNLDGLYAAGDITNNVFKQAITGASEGAIAAYSIYKELAKSK